MADYLNILKKILEFKGQETAFESIKKEGYKNIILSMPSNAKESLCYLIPEGYCASGVVLVISPYVERINHEIEYLKGLGISATTITSETSIEDREEIYPNFSHQFFYVTPEMIAKGFEKVRNFINYLLDSEICLVAVEEADLLMYKFRESYQVLRDVRTEYPNIPWIALTTESEMEIPKIVSSLSMTNPFTVKLPNA